MNFIKKKIKRFIKLGFDFFGYKIQKTNYESLKYTGASKILEEDYGHLLSKKTQTSINKNSKPLPWFTYPAIDFLSQLDFNNKTMLEWGSGNSSLFFFGRVKKLYSIEHNRDWYKLINSYQIENQILVFEEKEYSTKPKMFNTLFDIILIDGIERNECAEQAIDLISDEGLIILDNSDRHPDIAKLFRENEFIEVDFHGFGPINDYTWTTSIFMKRAIKLSPLTIQPKIPIGGGY